MSELEIRFSQLSRYFLYSSLRLDIYLTQAFHKSNMLLEIVDYIICNAGNIC